ncbi:COP9 signalosome complex subunit 12 [Angomonas deanei]|nr:COP9 signalosome complex subunit 12 [Angomonas deanei]|eukprot:EPY42571.1 COP9 signalosome complex subunit 12 [Angomonas deanei]
MMLKGLLHAFQSFQEVHGMERSHYPAREGSRTAGTVGWDTIVLLHFVHHIPHVARLAAEEAVAIEKHPDLTSDVRAAVDAEGDGGLFTGDVVRHWRRLLIAVQSADPTEAPEYSRRRGALSIVNGLLRVLFLHQNTHQCVMLLQAVEHTEETARTTGDTSKSILIPSKHITSEMVSYYYFKGRILIYQRRYEEALTALITSFEALPPLSYQASAAGPSKTPAQAIGREAQRNNKKRVTFFLCVAGLLAGRRCPPQVEAQGDDTMQCLFQPLYEAIGRGDPVRYTQALEQHGYVWRRRGVYVLLLQQGLLHCYLSLVKRVHLALGTLGVDNSRLTIPQLIAAYREIRGEGDRMAVEEEERSEMTEDRMVLWVTKLISIGYVKGYVSLEHMTVVVSKKEPFCQ